jgi:hypothetical protein
VPSFQRYRIGANLLTFAHTGISPTWPRIDRGIASYSAAVRRGLVGDLPNAVDFDQIVEVVPYLIWF